MSGSRDQLEAALARMEAMRAAEDQEHGFSVMRLVLADMQRHADAGEAVDAADLRAWTAQLRWLIATLDERNGAVLDAMQAFRSGQQ